MWWVPRAPKRRQKRERKEKPSVQPARFSLSSWQTSRTESSEAVRAGHRAGGAALLPVSSITLRHQGKCRRAGVKMSADGGQSQKRYLCRETAIGIWGGRGGFREVFLTWVCVEVELLHLSVRSLVLTVGWASA